MNKISTIMAEEKTGLAAFNATIKNPRTQDYLTSVLGGNKSSFVTSLTSLVSNNANLQKCEPLSLMYVGIKAAALNLPLDSNLGFAYAIPYKNNKTGITDAQFQIGYKGLIQLSIRSGQFQAINVTDVKEGEFQNEDMLSGEMSFKRVPDRLTKPTVGYVAFFRLINGFTKALYMTTEEVNAHAMRYSQTYSSKNTYTRGTSKWTTDFDAMAKKTVLKLLLSRYAPMSLDMQQAVQADQAVFTSDNEMRYIDNSTSQVSARQSLAETAEAAELDSAEEKGESMSQNENTDGNERIANNTTPV